MTRKLSLKKESLAELTADEMRSVVGGALTLPVNLCLSIQVCENSNNVRCTFGLVPTLGFDSCLC